MKYVLKAIYSLRQTLLISLLIMTGTLFWLIHDIRNGVRVLPPVWIFLGAWLILLIALIAVTAVTLKKEEPLKQILDESGFSDAYIAKFRETYPNLKTGGKLRLTGILTTAKRFSEAEQLLAEIPVSGLTEHQRMEYHTCQMDLLMSVHRMDEAIAELQRCRGFMDAYANNNPQRGIVYGLNAGVILAAANDYEGSEHYLQTAEHHIAAQKTMSPCLAQIARVMQLYLLGFPDRAQQLAEQTRLAIMQDPILTKDWQKQHFLEKLEDAKMYERSRYETK